MPMELLVGVKWLEKLWLGRTQGFWPTSLYLGEYTFLEMQVILVGSFSISFRDSAVVSSTFFSPMPFMPSSLTVLLQEMFFINYLVFRYLPIWLSGWQMRGSLVAVESRVQDDDFLVSASKLMFLFLISLDDWERLMPQMSLRYQSTLSFLLSLISVTMIFSHTISSSFLRKGCTTSDYSIWSTVMRSLGLSTVICLISSANIGGRSFRWAFWLGRQWGALASLSIDFAASDLKLLTSSSVGQPAQLMILLIWSVVFSPGNMGFWARISQMMQPKDQMSAGVEYFWDPRRTSGARYQRVATPSVRTGVLCYLLAKERTSPKSHNLIEQLELMRMLEGLRSRWMTQPECRYLRALAIWQTMKRMCTSFRMPSEMTLCRSASMNSNSRQTSLLLSALQVSCSLMMLGCESWRRISISRQVRWASVECWKASNIFFRASTFLLLFSQTFQTCPYAPEPIFFRTSQRCRMCCYIKLCSVLDIQFDNYIVITNNSCRADSFVQILQTYYRLLGILVAQPSPVPSVNKNILLYLNVIINPSPGSQLIMKQVLSLGRAQIARQAGKNLPSCLTSHNHSYLTRGDASEHGSTNTIAWQNRTRTRIRGQLSGPRIAYSFGVEIKDVPPEEIEQKVKAAKKVEPSAVERIIKEIQGYKQQPITSDTINTLCLRISRSRLGEQDRNIAIKYLLGILLKGDYPAAELITHAGLIQLIKGEVFVQLELYLYAIAKNKGNNVERQNLFLHCYEKILPSAAGSEKAKCESLFYKNFGKYLVEMGEQHKGLKFIQKSIASHRELIRSESEKDQRLNKQFKEEDKQGKKSSLEKQQQEIKSNALKENIRRLIESMYEVIYYYCSVMSPRVLDPKTTPAEKQDNIATLCLLINQNIVVKELLPGVELFSRYYHKLMQIYFELEYSFALLTKNLEKVKELRNKFLRFKEKCLSDLEELAGKPENQGEVMVPLLTTQLHLSRMDRGRSSPAVKEDILNLAMKIFEVGKMDPNTPARQFATRILTEFLKKNLE